ncbi:MAG: hypothetical protein QXX55_01975 [Candidatus Pacearchaeota archaeon]
MKILSRILLTGGLISNLGLLNGCDVQINNNRIDNDCHRIYSLDLKKGTIVHNNKYNILRRGNDSSQLTSSSPQNNIPVEIFYYKNQPQLIHHENYSITYSDYATLWLNGDIWAVVRNGYHYNDFVRHRDIILARYYVIIRDNGKETTFARDTSITVFEELHWKL